MHPGIGAQVCPSWVGLLEQLFAVADVGAGHLGVTAGLAVGGPVAANKARQPRPEAALIELLITDQDRLGLALAPAVPGAEFHHRPALLHAGYQLLAHGFYAAEGRFGDLDQLALQHRKGHRRARPGLAAPEVDQLSADCKQPRIDRDGLRIEVRISHHHRTLRCPTSPSPSSLTRASRNMAVPPC